MDDRVQYGAYDETWIGVFMASSYTEQMLQMY